MGGDLLPLDSRKTGSSYRGSLTQGFTVPDLSALDRDIRDKITGEVLVAAESFPEEPNEELRLPDYFLRRFGATATEIYSRMFERVYGVAADDLTQECLDSTPFGRLKHLSDPQMSALKSHSTHVRLAAT